MRRSGRERGGGIPSCHARARPRSIAVLTASDSPRASRGCRIAGSHNSSCIRNVGIDTGTMCIRNVSIDTGTMCIRNVKPLPDPAEVSLRVGLVPSYAQHGVAQPSAASV
jgi:hypothetical protein